VLILNTVLRRQLSPNFLLILWLAAYISLSLGINSLMFHSIILTLNSRHSLYIFAPSSLLPVRVFSTLTKFNKAHGLYRLSDPYPTLLCDIMPAWIPWRSKALWAFGDSLVSLASLASLSSCASLASLPRPRWGRRHVADMAGCFHNNWIKYYNELLIILKYANNSSGKLGPFQHTKTEIWSTYIELTLSLVWFSLEYRHSRTCHI
jgi:hypothetical protein